MGNFEDDQALVVRIYHGNDNDVSVDVYNYTGRKKLASYGKEPNTLRTSKHG